MKKNESGISKIPSVIFPLLMAGLFFMTGCIGKSGLPSGSGTNADNARMVMINVTGVTDNADMMLLCEDGSYVMACMNDGKGCGLIHIGLNAGGDETRQYTVMVGADGIPVAVGTDDGKLIRIANISDTDFDCAVIREGSEGIYYYWDIPYSFGDVGTKGLAGDVWDTFTSPFKEWYEAVSNGISSFTWDEHSKKMIYPYILKVCAFTIQTVTVVASPVAGLPSLLSTVIDEGCKSGLWDRQSPAWSDVPVKALDFLEEDGKWTLKFNKDILGHLLSAEADLMIATADYMYEELSRSNPVTEPVFESEEWQIKLSPTTIEAGPEPASYTAAVTSLALWKVEGGSDWCRARKDGDRVVVDVDAYNGLETRNCFLVVKTVAYTDDIPDALLHVVQQGVLLDLSESSFAFGPEGGHGGVYVNANDQIASWDVSGCPDWIRISGKSAGSFFFDVDENTEGEDRTGIITVSGITSAGGRVDRTVTVTQYGGINQGWDGTSWSFSGNVTCVSDGRSETIPVSLEMKITSVENGQVWISEGIGTPELSLSMDADGRLVIDAEYDESYTDEYGWQKTYGSLEFILERTGTMTSVCSLSGRVNTEVKFEDEYIHSVFIVDGILDGILENAPEVR